MGLSNLGYHNVSLLLRWWWKLYSDKTSYGPPLQISYIIGKETSGVPSYIVFMVPFSRIDYRISKISSLFTAWQLGDGESISFWYFHWPGRPLRSSSEPMPRLHSIALSRARHMLNELLLGPHTEQQCHALLVLRNHNLTGDADKLLWKSSSRCHDTFGRSTTNVFLVSKRPH
jgi:hypothetical protein